MRALTSKGKDKSAKRFLTIFCKKSKLSPTMHLISGTDKPKKEESIFVISLIQAFRN